MEEPLTEELLQQLLAAPSPAAFTTENTLGTCSLPDYLQQLLDERGLDRAQVVRDAGINETYGYQIFMGQRNPGRDKILQIVFAMKLPLREANRVLRASGASELYCKNRRDAIIIYCLDHGYTLLQTDQELYRFNEDTIC